MKYKLKIEKEYEIEAEDEEEAYNNLEERFATENTTASVEFWENLIIINEKRGEKWQNINVIIVDL